jgi:hypothetical protein
MWKCSGGIGGSNQSKFSLRGRIFEFDEGVSEWREAIGYSVINMAINVSVSNETMDNFGWTHK